MKIKIAFATEKYHHTYDSLYIFLEECLKRNWEVYWFVFESIHKENGTIYADLRRVKKHHLGITPKKMITYDKKFSAPLELMDVIFLKRDPPINKRALHLINNLNNNVFIINDPHGIIKYKSKSALKSFKKFMPPTYYSSHVKSLFRIIKKLGNCVVKEDDSHGGYGVHHICKDRKQYYVDDRIAVHKKINMDKFLKKVTKNEKNHVTVSKYLSRVTKGDKRIIVLDDHVVGSILRKPGTKKGWICNIKAGGIVEKAGLTKRERTIVHSIAPKLAKDRIYIAGFDTLEDDSGRRVLSEVNTTNVGAFHIVERLYKKHISKYVMDFVEKELRRKYHKK